MARPTFTSKNATELLRYAERILLKMTENAELFPDPTPALTTLESRLTAYRNAYAEAAFGDRRAVTLKKQRGDGLQETIYRLSHYVDKVAQGDPATILAAGYRPSRSKHIPIGRTPKARNLRVKHVQVGTGIIQLKVDPWKPARLYRFEYRKVGSLAWESVLDSKSRLELRGLEKLQEYEFRATYIGIDIAPNFSDTVTAIVV